MRTLRQNIMIDIFCAKEENIRDLRIIKNKFQLAEDISKIDRKVCAAPRSDWPSVN